MLQANEARQAIQDLFGATIEIGNPLPFIRGYDNVNGGTAAISNFNNLMKGTAAKTVSGSFGVPGGANNLSSNYPAAASIWAAIAFTDNGNGTASWTGTTPDALAVDILVNLATTTGAVAGTFGTNGGNDAAITWDANLYNGNRIDSGATSIVDVSSAATGLQIRFLVDLGTGDWTANVLSTTVVSSTGAGTSVFAPGGFQNVTGGTLTASFDTVTAITGTVGTLGTITGTARNNGGNFDIIAAALSIQSYVNVFYGEVTWFGYDDNLGAIDTQIVGRYFTALNGTSPKITLNTPQSLGAVNYDYRSGISQGIVLQDVAFASRCILNFSGYIFSLKAAP